jgi:hypothetical protein
MLFEDDLDPIRDAIAGLPEGERDAAAEAAGRAIAAKLVHDATTEDGALRRVMPPVPIPDALRSDGPTKIIRRPAGPPPMPAVELRIRLPELGHYEETLASWINRNHPAVVWFLENHEAIRAALEGMTP